MMLSFDETSSLIRSGKFLHIAGAGDLLRKLPQGDWVGGSTEYFMAEGGGITTGEYLFVTEFDGIALEYKICSYDAGSIADIALDAYEHGFSVVILPFDSGIHKAYAENAPEYRDIFMKNITGWISGINIGKPGQVPAAANGQTGEVFTDKAVAAHIRVPDGRAVSVGIVNIFSPDENSPVIEFSGEAAKSFSVETCFIDGKETNLADYLEQNKVDTRLPLIGDYAGAGVNVSIRAVEGGAVNLYAPVFPDICYRFAKPVDYLGEFQARLKALGDIKAAFSCNCVLNFLHGELEGKEVSSLFGPITFGEIAYQLVNQTLVYVTVL